MTLQLLCQRQIGLNARDEHPDVENLLFDYQPLVALVLDFELIPCHLFHRLFGFDESVTEPCQRQTMRRRLRAASHQGPELRRCLIAAFRGVPGQNWLHEPDVLLVDCPRSHQELLVLLKIPLHLDLRTRRRRNEARYKQAKQKSEHGGPLSNALTDTPESSV